MSNLNKVVTVTDTQSGLQTVVDLDSVKDEGGTSLSKASGAEVDSGTDDSKYVTPEALADSSLGSQLGVKRYVALLSQQTVSQTSGALIVGHTYVIFALEAGDDFTNVGYLEDGTAFVATGTTPTVFTNSTLVRDLLLSAPSATVLENSLSGPIVWSYISEGVYYGTLASAFPPDKTFMLADGGDTSTWSTFTVTRLDSDRIMVVASEEGGKIDGLVTPDAPGSIEIRVYP